jgi:tRNA pseudouridine65 synthase
MQLEVLARGTRWAIVAKPSGLPVHRSAMVRERDTVVRFARRTFGTDVSPVHRLDRATSGCLLLSLDPGATGALQTALTEGRKRYVAFVRGEIASREAVWVDTPMKDPDGITKAARTRATPIASSPDPRCSLVLAEPETGRWHQVRRHLRDLSHPILGDSTHGDTRVNRWWREERGLRRLGLHCLSIALAPLDGEVIAATCPVPNDLVRIWERLPWWGEAVAALPELALVLTPSRTTRS